MASKEKRNVSWIRSTNKNGQLGLSHLMDSIEHACEHKDWTPLAALLTGTEGADKTRMRAITGKVLGGTKLVTTSKEAKESTYGLVIKGFEKGGNAAMTERMDTLRDLVASGESFRGKAVSEALLGKEPPEFDLIKYMVQVGKRLEKNNVTLDQAITAMRTAEAKANGSVAEAA